MASTHDKIDLLEEFLKRNLRTDQAVGKIDLRKNEDYHYFYFDNIHDPNDLELAWSVFPEHQEIRKRLEDVEQQADIVSGWGYRVPKEENHGNPATCAELIRKHIQCIRPLIPAGDSILPFLDKPFEIILAPGNVAVPDAFDNHLFMALYEAMGEFEREHYPFEEPHYEVLRNWAIYLTKCDEVAFYLLWPCLRNLPALSDQTPNPGFRLWASGCRLGYWIKGLDFDSGVVYFRAPDRRGP